VLEEVVLEAEPLEEALDAALPAPEDALEVPPMPLEPVEPDDEDAVVDVEPPPTPDASPWTTPPPHPARAPAIAEQLARRRRRRGFGRASIGRAPARPSVRASSRRRLPAKPVKRSYRSRQSVSFKDSEGNQLHFGSR
jgi:hypothetical protein